MSKFAREFVGFCRFAAITIGLLMVTVLLLAALFVIAVQNGFMASEFSPTACAQDGGTWDHGVELCRRNND